MDPGGGSSGSVPPAFSNNQLTHPPNTNHSLIALFFQEFGSYYHLWVGLNDGSFLGYYNKGANAEADPNLYTISYMDSAQHECTQYNIVAPCREYFEADRDTGGSVSQSVSQAGRQAGREAGSRQILPPINECIHGTDRRTRISS